ncbi:MAG: long-chain-fatty-acid--CoA ligase [Xanthobacteraceae bacterium]|jgi:fatty-acyl-CoA synthase|nr:long-chain-fatty-acid--CoA ligase [Xanthobacteraceae bacterium]
MQGLMQHRPLLLSSLLEHARLYNGNTEIVSRVMSGAIERYGYADLDRRARKLAKALLRLGVRKGDRVATLAFNTFRHLELNYAVGGIGAICHTINPRLFHEQIRYILDHAEDVLLFVDTPLAPLARKIIGGQASIKKVIVLGSDADAVTSEIAGAVSYEAMIAAEDDGHNWEVFDELTACGLCYTSGTTGNPKGVLYSHRTTLLHAMMTKGRDCFDVYDRSTALALVPMFHANVSWGLPYAATMAGAKLVLPGAKLDGASLKELIVQEGVTTSNGVPTIWQVIIDELKKSGERVPLLERVVIAGSAPAPSMIETLEKEYGVDVGHVWGMTEVSPCGTSATMHRGSERLSYEEKLKLKVKQGRPIWGAEFQVTDPEGKPQARVGNAYGDLRVRGLWVLESYFKQEGASSFKDGWFTTGDVASIDEHGYVHLADRAKDLIKSGGEWISSIEVENVAVGHPGVAEAAVIGLPHPKWDERPVLIVIPKPGVTLEKRELLAFLEGKIAKWWMPDDVIFVSEIPHSATGKIQKVELRKQFQNYRIASAEAVAS